MRSGASPRQIHGEPWIPTLRCGPSGDSTPPGAQEAFKPKVPLSATIGRKLESRMEDGRTRLTCEEWMARLRKSLSSASALPVVVVCKHEAQTRIRQSGPELVTVEDFHRECIRIAAELQTARDSSGMLSFSPGETDAA